MMTLRRVLRLPAEAILCAVVGERKREGEERERDKQDPLEAEKEQGVSSILFFLSLRSLFFSLSPRSKRQFDRCFFIFFLSTRSRLFLHLLSQRRACCRRQSAGLADALRAQQTRAMSAVAATRPPSRDGGGGGVDAAAAAATTPTAATARPGSAAEDNKNSSGGRKEGSGRATQKRAFDLVLR